MYVQPFFLSAGASVVPERQTASIGDVVTFICTTDIVDSSTYFVVNGSLELCAEPLSSQDVEGMLCMDLIYYCIYMYDKGKNEL